jgi:hypothetical protein
MSEDVPQLTTGFCDQFTSSTSPEDFVRTTSPIVQILLAKAIETNGPKMWRTTISDGRHILPAIVSAGPSTLFEDGYVGKGSIVRLQGMGVHQVQGKRQVILRIDIVPVARPSS